MKAIGKLGRGCLMAIGVLFVLGVAVALLAPGGGKGSAAAPTAATIRAQAVATAPDATAAPEATEAPAPTAAPTEAPKALAVGDDVTVGEMRWKIVSAEDLGKKLKSDNTFIKDLTTSGRFVRVRFEMENLGKDQVSFGGLDLADSQGRSYKSSTDAMSFIPNEEVCFLQGLNPNVAKTCTAIYEVPAGASGLQAKVSDLKLFGSEEQAVDLGLDK